MHSVQSICTTFFEIYLPVKSSVLFYDPLISRPIISFILAISSSFSIGFRIKLFAGCEESISEGTPLYISPAVRNFKYDTQLGRYEGI